VAVAIRCSGGSAAEPAASGIYGAVQVLSINWQFA
jgi:hypothetical protein